MEETFVDECKTFVSFKRPVKFLTCYAADFRPAWADGERQKHKKPLSVLYTKSGFIGVFMVRLTGIEPVAPTVSRWCSPSELQPLIRDIVYHITG